MDGRRLVRALFVGGLLFLLAGGGMGFAMAATQGEDPVELAVPVPRPGDQVTYRAQRILLDEDMALGGTGDIRLDHVTYKWLPETWVVDETFGDRLARPLQAEYRYMSGTESETTFDRIVYYDAVDGRALFQRYGSGMVGTEGLFLDPDQPVVGGLGYANHFQTTYIADQYHYTRTPCGPVTPLQGVVYDGADVVLPGRCGWQDKENQILFRGEGWTGSGADRAYRFSAVQDDRLRMWFTNAMPFPARLTSSSAEITDPDWAVGRLFRLDVESFTPGSGAYTTLDPASLPPAAGAIPLAPRTAWTLDDAGMEEYLPLTLSQAYAAALAEADPSQGLLGQPNVADWQRNHPDGYLAAAWALEYHDDSGETLPQWIMLWVDGASWVGKRVSWEAASQGLLFPAPVGRHAEVTDWSPSWLPTDVDAFFPDLDQLPAAFPRPHDMVDGYHRTFGAESRLNRYGFQVYCTDKACSDPQTLVEVGRHDEDLGTRVGTVETRSDPTDDRLALVDKLMVDATGEASYQMRFVQATEALLPLADDPPGMPAPAAVASAPGPSWVPPLAPAAATGIGLFAILGAALYYFWPALKHAALAPLFSRIEDDDVLRHPNRARIAELIRAEPGIHFQDLARKAGVGRGTLEHHLRKLVDADVVTVRRSSGYSCCFPKGAGAIDRRLMDAAPVLRSEGGRAVLQVVARRPGTSSRDLAVELGLAPSTVSYHLKKLELAGLVLPDPAAGVRLTALGEQAKA